MLYEYAVEPRALGSSYQRFLYLIEKFGFDKGRLISEFPKKLWFREVYDAAQGFSPTQKSRLQILLQGARGTKVIRTGRIYDRIAGDWIHNALAEHRRAPFHAIIASENPGDSNAVLVGDDEMDEKHPLMMVANNRAIPRDANSIASALSGFIEHGSRVLFVDPFYDPYSLRYKNTLRECLRIAKGKNPVAEYEIHYRHHPNKAGQFEIERDASTLFRGVILGGMTVKILCWREKSGGADWHARYLLTDKGGLLVEAGFSAEGGHETTDMYLMDLGLCQEKIIAFTRAADVYELVGPVLLVDSNCKVTQV